MSSRNYKNKNFSKIKPFVTITTRSGLFSGLSFKITKQSDIQKANYLTSVPNISFSFDYSSVIIDYAQSTSQNDRDLINALFFEMKPGTNFTLSQATHLIEDPQSEADLSGTYSFVRLVNYAIIAQPVTVNSINQRITMYLNKHMKSIPQIGLSTVAKNPIVTYTLTNNLISDRTISLINFGIYPKDRIKITGTNKNNKIFTVLSVFKNSDGTETIVLDEEVSDEVCFGNPILLEVLQQGAYDLVDKNTSIETGSCNFTLTNGTAFCYQDQTQNQCDIRASGYSGVTPKWTKNGTCSNGTDRKIQVQGKRRSASTTYVSSIVSRVSRPSISLATSEIPSVAAD
jgi:hypothetical protein